MAANPFTFFNRRALVRSKCFPCEELMQRSFCVDDRQLFFYTSKWVFGISFCAIPRKPHPQFSVL
jgi:hypothetical protein